MKRKKILFIAAPALLAAIIAFVFIVKADNLINLIKPNPAFKDYISAYTSGVISTHSAIKIRMAEPYADSSIIGKKLDGDLFKLSPDVKGTVKWIDPRTIQFQPSEQLDEDKTYTVDFSLDKLIDVADSLKVFQFQFHTIKQNFETKVLSINTYDETNSGEYYFLEAVVKTADKAKIEVVKNVIKAYHLGNELNIKWSGSKKGKSFEFRIDSIQRQKKETELRLVWNGRSMGVKKKGEKLVNISGREDFRLIDIETSSNPQQIVLLNFSDPLNKSQVLDGLIRIGNIRNLQFEIDKNRIKVYLPNNYSGDQTVNIESSLLNISNKPLGKKVIRTISMESLKPNVRMVGEGTILPSSNKLSIPFEAVNLKAVDVKVLKVYEQNVPQFLQVNELSGTNQMYRVGRVVYKEKLDLTKVSKAIVDYNSWNRFYLDLSKLIKTEQGAIYRVVLSFRKEYSTYPCEDSEESSEDDLYNFDFDEVEEVSDDEWGYYSDYDYEPYYYRYYNWSERDNPCSQSYYHGKTAARNVLASDIGLITKRGTDGSLTVFATDIVTAKPLKGIKLELLDYQQQVLKSLITDDEGKAEVVLKRRPFLLIARNGDQRGYLKLNDGNALSLSLFDVDGDKVKRGVKGFLYAERGVWRPGDTMFINFIMEDKSDNIPDDVPVLFELSDPTGQVVRRMMNKEPVKNIYPFHVATDRSGRTGNYLAKVFIGNMVFSRYFKVETVKPNRLKIDIAFNDNMIKAFAPKPIGIKSTWLHGAKGSNLKARIEYSLERGVTKFDGYKNYTFDNPASTFYTETYTIFDGKLDENGQAFFDIQSRTSRTAPGVLRANFNTKVFEPSGNFSINTISVPYYPYESYSGLWVPNGKGWWDALETGKKHRFQLANVDYNGKALKSSKLKVEVYRIDWSWWYESSSHRLSSFLSSSENIPVYKKTISLKNGKGHFDWGMENEAWGRYLVFVTDLQSGHSTGKMIYLDWPGYSRRHGSSKEGATMLTFSSDKEKYNVGEDVNLTIPSSVSGRALVSIENGSHVISSKWIDADSGTSKFSFKATADMAPNVYVHVTLIQPHAQTANDLPIRLYGVIPIKVEDPNTHLYPQISMKNKLRPESKVNVKVSEKNGKGMAYTLAIVDEGLLDLTNYKTPDPWNHFYSKEALGVKTWDLFDDVMGAWGAEIERLLSIGGGDTRVNSDKQKANRFKPVVKFIGPFYLEKGKTASHTFTMPQYVGSVKVMVVAANNGAYGSAEKSVKVTSPLMVTGTLPRVVGPGETVSLPVNVFAMEKQVKNVTVKLQANEMFKITGKSSAKVSFSEPGEKMVYFDLKVLQKIGIGKVKIIATDKNEQASYDVELDVRLANPEVSNIQQLIVDKGKSVNETIKLGGIDGTNKVRFELSVLPPMNLSKRIDYLIRYPHGCLEQTTSAAFPQLFLSDLVKLDKRSKTDIENNIKAALLKLKRFQHSDGSFTYWPGGSYRNSWSNVYAGHFMIEAEKKGYEIPSGLKKSYLKSLANEARAWTKYSYYRYDDLIQANRLYMLALAGKKEMGAMNRLKNHDNLSLQASWRLAAAYAVAGKKKIARKMVEKLSTDIMPYVEYSYTFGSRLRDKAIIVETMLLVDDHTSALKLVKEIAEKLNSRNWYSTQTTAFCLNAVAKYYSSIGGSSKDLKAKLVADGKTINVVSDKPMYVYDLLDLKGSNEVKMMLENQSGVPMFLNIINSGTPLPGDEKENASKLKIKVTYLSNNGSEINPAAIKQGTDFSVRVSIVNPTASYYKEMALTQIFPSGWEILNDRLSGFSDTRIDATSNYTYQDIRDDRVLTYFNISPYKTKTFYVKLNATYAGKYYLPAVLAETMYADDVFANTKGFWVDVIPAK
jgi:uncharacterized protein YfaS (alpha-2-macroglobulin family)